jgi:hypothetical protein
VPTVAMVDLPRRPAGLTALVWYDKGLHESRKSCIHAFMKETRSFAADCAGRGTGSDARVLTLLHRATSAESLPKYLSSDNDPLFRFHRWGANLRVLKVEEVKRVPSVPCSHTVVERLIGTIRRSTSTGSCSGIGVTSRESSGASGTATTEGECTHHLVVKRLRWEAVDHPGRARNSTPSRGYRVVRGSIRHPWLRKLRIRQGQSERTNAISDVSSPDVLDYCDDRPTHFSSSIDLHYRWTRPIRGRHIGLNGTGRPSLRRLKDCSIIIHYDRIAARPRI